VGKSTFINALRGLRDVRPPELPGENVSAAVDITETTMIVKRYRFPRGQFPHVAIWDLSGGGTQAHPAETYFEDKLLYAFDCLLLLSANRFSELEVSIARRAQKFRTPVVLVITKGDRNFADEQRYEKTQLGRPLN
jgi:hypothetical protein